MRIVHLGLGNFHRAHQAVYTQDAGDAWGITGVAHRSHDVVEALSRQDHRYSLVIVDGDEVEVRPVETVTEGLVLAAQPDAVVARIADAQTAVVTLTITEKGYALRPDGSLDTTSPEIAADLLGDAPPRSALGALCLGLQARAGAAGDPLTVVSCDNLAGNGPLLAGAVREFVSAAGFPPDVAAWIDERVGFPATMVDRIVPATTTQTLELARAAGFDDAVPVPAERFSQWVLQPDFRGPRPAWETAGAVFTDDVAAWETVKVRLLNGVHSLLAYLGLLRGDRLIAEAHSDTGIRTAAGALGDEYVPTLRVPAGLDVVAYRAALGRRFDNAALGHRCAQVATDGSVKLAQRVPVAAAWHLDRGQVPHLLALLVAAWLECLSDPGAVAPADRPRDPAASRLALLAASAPGPADLARVVLHDEALLGEPLGGYGVFVDRVGELLGVLRRHGPDTAAHEAVVAGAS